jgi:hypothetical protein
MKGSSLIITTARSTSEIYINPTHLHSIKKKSQKVLILYNQTNIKLQKYVFYFVHCYT